MGLKIKTKQVANTKLTAAIKAVQNATICKLTVNIPKSLKTQFKIKAELNDTDMTTVLLSYIKQYIQK